MFWRFGGYANISTLDTILDKPDVTLEELLDESDLIQELKQHNSKLIEYLRDENVLRRLLEYVVAPSLIKTEDGLEDEEIESQSKKTFSPVRSISMGRSKEQKESQRRLEEREERDKADKVRQKYAYVACEVLSSETWSILEALMENQQHLRKFWEVLKREPPLDPIIAGYFLKINETLLDKKVEETLDFVKSLDGVVPAMLAHVDCPTVMDLLLKIISMEKVEGGQGIVDWLQSQDLMPLLLAYLEDDHPAFTQTAAGDFIKAIITISANASQTEQSCIGPNSLTRQLVSETCIESLITNMLRGGNPLTVGVGIIIEVIRKNNSDYDPDVGTGQDSTPSSSDPIYLGTLLRMFAKHVPDFTELILSPNHTVANGDSTMTIKRKELQVAFGGAIEPLGFDRFKTCELMAELLHCSNMGLLNERGSEAFVRQRDMERDRLKAEGALQSIREPQSAVTEISEGSATFQNGQSPSRLGSGSSEEINKLEIANSAEEDGFEDVGASADFSDDTRDDFDDKIPFELESNSAATATPVKTTKAPLDLDEEFFDEPLSSPRLEAIDEQETEVVEHPDTGYVPEAKQTSPTSEMTSAIGNLRLHHKPDATDNQPLGTADRPLIEDPSSIISSSHLPSQASSSDAPPLPHRDRNSNSSADTTTEPSSSRELSQHPDDKPPPLFANRLPEASVDEGHATHVPVKQSNVGGSSQETIDTTLGEEGDSGRSGLFTSNDQSFAPHIESDVDGQPIVGDFLKMMFVEHQVVPTILDFFFRFPWNNFLHNVVYDVVQQVFNGPMDRGYNRSLAIDLFQSGRITERIIEGQLRSDEAQQSSNMRLGYMGHLTLIAEEVVKFTERHTAETLSEAVLDKVMNRVWSDYVQNSLSETRERDAAILGGVKPDVSVGARQAVLNAVNAAHGYGSAGSSALTNAGLNGGSPALESVDLTNNSNTSSGTLGLGGGSLLSGFGSSSDEEDEEMEEPIEHDDGGDGASDQYPTYAPSSLSALSIFSPPLGANAPDPQDTNVAPSSSPSSDTNPLPLPPPLNVPPSRARRQLEARLRLHGKSASPFSSPQPSPNDSDPLQEPNPPTTPTLVISQDPQHVFDAAIDGQKTETPFGDLELMTAEDGGTQPGMAALRELYPEDFDTAGNVLEAGEREEGHDIPISIALHPPPRSMSGVSEGTTGTNPRVGDGKTAKKVSALFRQGGSSSGSGSSDEEDERRMGVREARVRSAIEEEGDE